MLSTQQATQNSTTSLPSRGLNSFFRTTLSLAAVSLLANCAGFEQGFNQAMSQNRGGYGHAPQPAPAPYHQGGYHQAPSIPSGGNSAWNRVGRAAELPPAQLSWDASQNFYGATQLSYAEQQYRQAEHQGRMQPLQNARQQLWETQNTIEQFRQFGQYLQGFRR